MFARVLLHQEAEPQTKSLEDLEFQRLEGEINHAEETDSPNQELLREIAEYQRLAVTRKVQHRLLPHREISAIVRLQPAAIIKVNYLFLASLVSGKPQVTCRNSVKINGPGQICYI